MKQSIAFKDTLKEVCKNKGAFWGLLGINALCAIVVFAVLMKASKVVSANFVELKTLATGPITDKFVVLIVLLLGFFLIPLIIFTAFRLAVRWMLVHTKPSNFSEMVKWLWVYGKFVVLWAIILLVWSQLVLLLKESLLIVIARISAGVLGILFLLWLEAISLGNLKRPIRKGWGSVRTLLFHSGGLALLGVGLALVFTAAFSLFGRLWAGSFDSQVYLTSVEWSEYLTLFRLSIVVLVLVVYSLAQVHYAKVMKAGA